MVARRRLTSLKWRFSATSIDADRGKAKSLRSGRKKIVAKFFLAFLKEKRSARRSHSLCATKMRVRKIMQRSRRHFAHHTPILPTKPNTEFETGRAAVAPRRAKQLDVWPPAQSRARFCAR